MTHIQLKTDINAPPEICFDLALNVDVQLSLGKRMQAVAGVTAGSLVRGDTVTWRAWHFGLPWHMTSEIWTVERPHRFSDRMLHGPFSYWRHSHSFDAGGASTHMTDDVEYGTPLGALGHLFDAAVLERYMIRLLTSRNRQLKLIAEKTAQVA